MKIGVDLGGTKIEVIALDDAGATLLRHRVATPRGDYPRTLDVIVNLICSVEAQLHQMGTVGVASPGAISKKTGMLKNSNSTVLNGRALDRDLSERLKRPVRLENDANCLALSEVTDGAAVGKDVVFGVILGTGVGGGVVVDGRLVAGHNGVAGEWGHSPLPWDRDDERPGAPCYCGKKGCIETFLCGEGLAREYLARSGRRLTAQEIAQLGTAGDDCARQCLTVYRDRLARSLATVVNLIDPDAIVLGGGLSNIDQLYDGLTGQVATYAFSDGIDTPIVRAVHGDSSGVRGAAWLCEL
jgi:fructokinase